MNIRVFPTSFQGTITLPSSKSWSHRALILSGLSQGRSTLQGLTMSNDLLATQACLSQWGVTMDATSVNGPINKHGPTQCHAGASGTTLRMLLPVSLLSPHPTTWTGEARLIDRSLKSLARLCHTHGLRFQHHDPHHQLPLTVQGPLQPGDYVIDSTETSQFISGLLMVLPLLHGASTLTLQGTRVSSPYIHMTVAMMKQWGVTVSEKSSTFYIPGNQHYLPQIVTAEPDASHAAFFLCGGTLQGKITLRGRFDHAHQGDVILIEQLRNHGASIIDTEAGYVVQSSALQPFDWQLADVPDLAPMLILTSAFIDGVSNFAALSRLNDKESLRFDHIQTYLRLWNIPFTATADTIRVVGSSLHRIPEGRYPTYHDHRFAMALAMLSPQAASSYVIEGVECINKSYPTFLSDYTTLQGQWMKEEVQ